MKSKKGGVVGVGFLLNVDFLFYVCVFLKFEICYLKYYQMCIFSKIKGLATKLLQISF